MLVRIERFNQIINQIEARCMATDGPVTPTLQEMIEEEMAEIWRLLKSMSENLCDHSGYDFDKHGRCCPHCGVFMVDWGD